MVAYYKPPLRRWWEVFADSATGGKQKDGHDWQQAEAEAEHYIKALCPRDGMVVDPMCGSGTVPAVALRLGRRCVAIESDGSTYNYAVERIDGVRKELSARQEGPVGDRQEGQTEDGE